MWGGRDPWSGPNTREIRGRRRRRPQSWGTALPQDLLQQLLRQETSLSRQSPGRRGFDGRLTPLLFSPVDSLILQARLIGAWFATR
jgi:hypothetical protein